MQSIGTSAFLSSDVRNITIPAGVTTIGDTVFLGNNNLTTVAFASGSRINRIGEFAFWGTAINSIILPPSLESLGRHAFNNTPLFNSAPNNSVVYAGNWALEVRGNISGTYTMRAGTVGVADNMMENRTGITGLILPGSLRHIGTSAFRNTRFSTLTIPESISRIDALAFSANPNLQTVNILATDIQRLGTEIFVGSHALLEIMVSFCSLGTYREMARNCNHTRSRLQARPLVIDISEGTFELDVFVAGWDSYSVPVYFTGEPGITASFNLESIYGAGGLSVVNPRNGTTIINVRDYNKLSFNPTQGSRYILNFITHRNWEAIHNYRITIRSSEWEKVYSGSFEYFSLFIAGINSSLLELDMEFLYGGRWGVSYMGEHVVQISQGTSGYRHFLLNNGGSGSLWISFVNGNLNVRLGGGSINLVRIAVYRKVQGDNGIIVDKEELLHQCTGFPLSSGNREVTFHAPGASIAFFNRQIYVIVTGSFSFRGVLTFVDGNSGFVFTQRIPIGANTTIQVQINHSSQIGRIVIESSLSSWTAPTEVWLVSEESAQLVLDRNMWQGNSSITHGVSSNLLTRATFLITVDRSPESGSGGPFFQFNKTFTWDNAANMSIGNNSTLSVIRSNSSEITVSVSTNLASWGFRVKIWVLQQGSFRSLAYEQYDTEETIVLLTTNQILHEMSANRPDCTEFKLEVFDGFYFVFKRTSDKNTSISTLNTKEYTFFVIQVYRVGGE